MAGEAKLHLINCRKFFTAACCKTSKSRESYYHMNMQAFVERMGKIEYNNSKVPNR